MTQARDLLAAHPLAADLPPDIVERLSAHAMFVRFRPGRRIFVEGGKARYFWLIRSGTVSLDVTAAGRPAVPVETLHDGDVLGWSWLFAPHEWHFAATAITETEALEFDATAVRTMCADDPALGYEVLRQFVS